MIRMRTKWMVERKRRHFDRNIMIHELRLRPRHKRTENSIVPKRTGTTSAREACCNNKFVARKLICGGCCFSCLINGNQSFVDSFRWKSRPLSAISSLRLQSGARLRRIKLLCGLDAIYLKIFSHRKFLLALSVPIFFSTNNWIVAIYWIVCAHYICAREARCSPCCANICQFRLFWASFNR